MKQIIRICGKEIRVSGSLLRTAELEGDGYEFLDDPEPMLTDLRRSGSRIDLFTFMQKLTEATPKYPYYMEWDNLAAVPVSTFEEWWNRQIRPEARNRARQAEKKGVILREVPFGEELIRGIWEIYNECPIRQGRPFPHYGKDIETVYREEATFLDSSIFIGAFLGNHLIGFIKLVSDETRTQTNLMNILSMVQHRDKAPTNALIAQAVRSCAERSISYLVYQRYYYDKKRPDGITRFKEVNGFKRVDLPRYYVPLTCAGWVGLQFGLQHRLLDRLPEPVIAKVRKLRDARYNRKSQNSTEVS